MPLSRCSCGSRSAPGVGSSRGSCRPYIVVRDKYRLGLFVIILVFILTSIAACEGGAVPPVATGPWTALNADQWTPTEAEKDWLRR